MALILTLDLVKYKSVACHYDTETRTAEFETILTSPSSIETLLKTTQPIRYSNVLASHVTVHTSGSGTVSC